ncbi:MAG: hypothetical protein ACLUTU_06100 [Blautia faecis]
MKQIKEILIASVSLFLLGFGICMAVSTFFMYREGEQEYETLREYVNEEEREKKMKARSKTRHWPVRRPLIFKP